MIHVEIVKVERSIKGEQGCLSDTNIIGEVVARSLTLVIPMVNTFNTCKYLTFTVR